MYPRLWSEQVEARVRAEARNLDPQETPDEIRMCKRCVVTNQRPRIVFDDNGICSACRYAERKASGIDWAARRNDLESLLSAHRGSGAYDVVVPCSGGKDSAFVAHTLKHEFGMNPLCARWAPHIITEIGRRNWQSFIHSGYDAVTAQPNGLLHRKLSRLALEFYGDPFLPFIYGQLAWPMHVAQQNNISLVFYGENGEAEYGGDPSANDKPCWDEEHWERVYQKGAGVNRLTKLALEFGVFTLDEANSLSRFYEVLDLPPLLIVTANKVMDGEFNRALGAVTYVDKEAEIYPVAQPPRPEFHWLGYYLSWHPQGNYYHACEHTGFEANEERSEGTYSKYASIDDKLDGLHYYLGFVKFGIGRCTSDAAHEGRDGDLARDEALALVGKYDSEFPERHLRECLDYLGMDRDQLDTVIARFSPDHQA